MFSILFKFKNAVILYLVYNVLNVTAKDEPPILSEEERFLRLDEAVDLDDILLDIVDGLVGHHGISCVAFVCDSVYLNVFGGEFFKKLNLTSSVMERELTHFDEEVSIIDFTTILVGTTLRSMLESTTAGKPLLKKQVLTTRDRKIITAVIVESEVRKLKKVTDPIRKEVWENWTKEIVSLFPEETNSVYYSPFRIVEGRAIQASGLIINRLITVRRNLSTPSEPRRSESRSSEYSSDSENKKKKRRTSDTPGRTRPLPENFNLLQQLQNEEASSQDDVQWLKVSSSPRDLAKSKWHNTLRERVAILEGSDYIAYCKTFPAIQSPWGYELIVPKESEDLLSPNYDTLEALRRVRKDGCGAYVILMANGIQSARLLKFGDRYRAIDTRAKFVILHDFRLFKGDLHYIWKRIVNVVFLRRHSSNAEAAWYDVTTVPFPSPIRGVLLPRRLDTWRRGRFRDDAVLFQDKTKDLNGQTLNVVYLQHVPAVVRDADAIGGLEMQILKTLAEAINFKTKVYEPPNVETQQWGQRQVNGTFSGLLGEMAAGKADIALGDLHYTPYHLELTDLTIPYISQCLTFLTPESLTDNAWKTLILPFQLDMWLGVMAVLFGTGFLFNILAKIQRYLQQSSGQFENNSENNAFEVDDRKGAPIKKKERPVQTGLYLFDELANGIVYTFGMLMLVSLPKFPLGWSIRVLTGWYWLYCILLAVAYKASMTAILANPAPKVTIDTLDQLVDSEIRCGGWGSQVKLFFETSLDETGQQIGSVFEMVNDAASAVDRVAEGQFAYYENVYFLKDAIAKRQERLREEQSTQRQSHSNDTTDTEATVTPDKSDHNLHIMDDCVINMPISIGLEKNSPLKPLSDKYIRKIIEAGLVQKWLDDVMLPILTAQVSGEDRPNAVMNLRKLYGGFIALSIGSFFGFIILLGEIIHWYFIVQRDPKFDKYALSDYYNKKK